MPRSRDIKKGVPSRESDSTTLAEAKIILRCFCRLNKIKIPRLKMPARVIQAYLSIKKLESVLKSFFVMACPRKLQFPSHYDFSRQEACG